jgi:hypothetical protein
MAMVHFISLGNSRQSMTRRCMAASSVANSAATVCASATAGGKSDPERAPALA